jgi:hypothetical protein
MECHFIQNSNSLLPIVAIVISCISLFFSFLTARHNRKTVEPYLTDTYEVNEDINTKLPYRAYHLKNCGFGPAILKEITFSINGKDYKEIFGLISENANNISYDFNLSSTSLSEGYILTPNEDRIIFKLYFGKMSLDSVIKFQELLSNISISVKYESVYKKKKHLYTKSIIRLNN